MPVKIFLTSFYSNAPLQHMALRQIQLFFLAMLLSFSSLYANAELTRPYDLDFFISQNGSIDDPNLSYIAKKLDSYKNLTDVNERLDKAIEIFEALRGSINGKEVLKGYSNAKLSQPERDIYIKQLQNAFELLNWGTATLSNRLLKISKEDVLALTADLKYSHARNAGVIKIFLESIRRKCDEAEFKNIYEKIVKGNESKFIKNLYPKYAVFFTEKLEKENYPIYRAKLKEYFSKNPGPNQDVLLTMLNHHFSDEYADTKVLDVKLNEQKGKIIKLSKINDVNDLSLAIAKAAPNCLGFGFNIDGAKYIALLLVKLKAHKFLSAIELSKKPLGRVVSATDVIDEKIAKSLSLDFFRAILVNKTYTYFIDYNSPHERLYIPVTVETPIIPLVSKTITEQEYNVITESAEK